MGSSSSNSYYRLNKAIDADHSPSPLEDGSTVKVRFQPICGSMLWIVIEVICSRWSMICNEQHIRRPLVCGSVYEGGCDLDRQ